MSEKITPLQALQNIVNHLDLDVLLGGDYRHYKRDIKIVTDALKAIEIIVKKRVDVNFFLRMLEEWGGLPYNTGGDDKKALQMYNKCHEYKLTQEEFDLLKEVLK